MTEKGLGALTKRQNFVRAIKEREIVETRNHQGSKKENVRHLYGVTFISDVTKTLLNPVRISSFHRFA